MYKIVLELNQLTESGLDFSVCQKKLLLIVFDSSFDYTFYFYQLDQDSLIMSGTPLNIIIIVIHDPPIATTIHSYNIILSSLFRTGYDRRLNDSYCYRRSLRPTTAVCYPFLFPAAAILPSPVLVTPPLHRRFRPINTPAQ